MPIDVVVYFGQFLLDCRLIGEVQAICEQHAPAWSSKLRVWPSSTKSEHIDLSDPSSLYNSLKADLSTPGEFYRQLETAFGSSRGERICGTSELRGADNSLTLVFSVDERTFCKISDIWIWGNGISVQLRRKRIEGINASSFAVGLLKDICNRLEPWYAHAECTAEFDAKNVSHEGGGTAAIGVDISKSLPGLYWLNYFGGPSVESIGTKRLEECPALKKEKIRSGYFIALSDDPHEWASEEYRLVERKVLKSLGERWFFHRNCPELSTKSPFF